MMKNTQWMEEMFEGARAAFKKGTINMAEYGEFRLSVKKPIDENEMNTDTFRRLRR